MNDHFWNNMCGLLNFKLHTKYQGGVKSTVSGVFEDPKFKISEGSDQNWSCPGSALSAVSVAEPLNAGLGI